MRLPGQVPSQGQRPAKPLADEHDMYLWFRH